MDIKPDADTMQAFLHHLFGDVMTGRLELAWVDASDKQLRHARSFDVGEIEELVEAAVELNKVKGQNVYIGAALRAPTALCPAPETGG